MANFSAIEKEKGFKWKVTDNTFLAYNVKVAILCYVLSQETVRNSDILHDLRGSQGRMKS